MLGDPRSWVELVAEMTVHALKREKLELACRVLARVLQAVISGRRESCQKDPDSRHAGIGGQDHAEERVKIGGGSIEDGEAAGPRRTRERMGWCGCLDESVVINWPHSLV